MTPLASKVAHQLTAPKNQRWETDHANVGGLVNQDLHCFDISAITKSVHDVMDAGNVWLDVLSLLPRMFLPSPVTWLEFCIEGKRMAWVLDGSDDGWFKLALVCDKPDLYSLAVCDFRACSILENADRIEVVDRLSPSLKDVYGVKEPKSVLDSISDRNDVRMLRGIDTLGDLTSKRDRLSQRIDMYEFKALKLNDDVARLESGNEILKGALNTKDPEIERAGMNHGIAFCALVLDLINTPGLIGLRQHDPHRGLVKRLATAGSYPLQGWSEVVLKHKTVMASQEPHLTGPTYHKCLHFVRSHLRHLRCGRVLTIPAHWRGDAALGIKRTRYRLAA